uniref:Uncharacterized protein n=1 Tax=Anguilla anguilla TaxID=7936 RepID=A0A0E9R293_ANGAN
MSIRKLLLAALCC